MAFQRLESMAHVLEDFFLVLPFEGGILVGLWEIFEKVVVSGSVYLVYTLKSTNKPLAIFHGCSKIRPFNRGITFFIPQLPTKSGP